MRDRDVRPALLAYLAPERAAGAMVVEEMGLLHGSVRADVVLLSEHLHGYEVKAAKDNMKRLPNQVRAYGAVMDKATLVVAEAHLPKALTLLPEWWGVLVATAEDGRLCLEQERVAAPNPDSSLLAVVKLLWREEALEALARHGLARGLRKWPRGRMYARLVEAVPAHMLKAEVLAALRGRKDWRPSG